MKAAASVATGPDWESALGTVLDQLKGELTGSHVDLAVLFASPAYAESYPELVAEARHSLSPSVLVGCSGQGIIGGDKEVEDQPAVSVLAFSLPGAAIRAFPVDQTDIANDAAAAHWLDSVDAPVSTNAWLILADPFSLDTERLLAVLGQAYPDAPLAGGLASGDTRVQGTYLFLDDAVLKEGAVALAIGGDYTVQTVVSQGAEPIGRPWTITGVRANVVESLGARPAMEILYETFQSLPPAMQERARRNLLVGLAMNEYKDEFRRGDFLIRNLMGIDQERGAIAIGAIAHEGQTLQFQLRDPEAADSELTELLGRAKSEMSDDGQPVGAILFACNGRGVGLFGTPNHDAAAVREQLGSPPLAGFFCNGEIGPVGGKPFVHGFTASLALIVPKAKE